VIRIKLTPLKGLIYQVSQWFVWGPGAGVEAAGRLWSGQNRPGVAGIPEPVAKMFWRKSREDRTSARNVAWEAVRQNEMLRELARARERSTSPKSAKGLAR